MKTVRTRATGWHAITLNRDSFNPRISFNYEQCGKTEIHQGFDIYRHLGHPALLGPGGLYAYTTKEAAEKHANGQPAILRCVEMSYPSVEVNGVIVAGQRTILMETTINGGSNV